MAKLKVTIIGKDKIAYEGEAEAVFVPTQTGIIEVLPNHAQLVSALSSGELVLKTGSEDKKFKVSGGVLEVRPESHVVILADLINE